MNILIDKSFEKDCNKISNKQLLIKIANVITDVKNAKSISQIKNRDLCKAETYITQ